MSPGTAYGLNQALHVETAEQIGAQLFFPVYFSIRLREKPFTRDWVADVRLKNHILFKPLCTFL